MKFFNVTNHKLTDAQQYDVHQTFNADIIELNDKLKQQWGNVDPYAETVDETVQAVFDFITANSAEGDMALVQGDMGCVFALVNMLQHIGITAVYATTKRSSIEQQMPDGTVVKKSTFVHVQFRKYKLHA